MKLHLAIQGGEWVIYVSPKTGWAPPASSVWPLRIAIAIIMGILIWAFTFFLKMLNRQKQNEKMLSSMSRVAQIGAWSYNLETQKVYWSDTTKKIFKYPLDQQPNWPNDLNYFKEGKSRDKIKELITRAIKHDENYETELEIVDATGNTVWVLVHGETEVLNGRCVRIFGSLQDINTRKCTELENNKFALHNEVLASLTVNKAILTGHLKQSKDVITHAICNALDVQRASIWLFNDNTQQLELFDFYTSKTKHTTLPVEGNVLDLKSNYNFCWLLTDKYIYTYNYFGSLVSKQENNGFEQIAGTNGNVVLKSNNSLFLLSKNSSKITELDLPKLLINRFFVTNETLYIYDQEMLNRYQPINE